MSYGIHFATFPQLSFILMWSNKMSRHVILAFTILLSFNFLSSCQSNLLNSEVFTQSQNSATAVGPSVEILSTNNDNSSMADVAAINEALDASVAEIPTISAVGYAVVSSQPGKSENQKRLMAIRSARMAAMRELAEQIHGLKVEGNTTVIDLMVQNDTFRAVVKGIIRGAKTVRINPTGVDTYETVLEIDKDMMLMMLRNARRT